MHSLTSRRILIALLALLTTLPLLVVPADATPDSEARASIRTVDDTVLVTVANATVTEENGYLAVRDAAGRLVDRLPLAYIAPDTRTYPIELSVSGRRSARLTPVTDHSRSTTTNPALLERSLVADENGYETLDQRDDAALTRLGKEVAMGVTVSTVIGAALGAIVGGIIGCIAGAALGCFFTGLAGVPVGATIGVILAGGVAGAAVLHYFDTIRRPFKHVTPTA